MWVHKYRAFIDALFLTTKNFATSKGIVKDEVTIDVSRVWLYSIGVA